VRPFLLHVQVNLKDVLKTAVDGHLIPSKRIVFKIWVRTQDALKPRLLGILELLGVFEA